ncbi:uncharacterized protein LOC119381744 [Rhipicephalus sanguineus]|uniref:uncharacterized protein LOC119381744 n=1 Tax=Rhipicephalus sanguineus TaxID=34632 RepID=UPI00189394ED|nr:uncharacterized protein LOC119381744 [Rhipicephalus sanguineus]
MSQEQTSAASTPTPTGSVPYYRVPPNFGGTSEEDVDVWLKNYKRVSRSNGWDSEAQLRRPMQENQSMRELRLLLLHGSHRSTQLIPMNTEAHGSGFSHRTPPNYGRRFRSPGYRQRTSLGYGAPEERHYYSMPSERSGYSEQPPVSRPHPMCYNCGVPGHIARFCNHRSPYQRQPSQPFDRPLYTPRPPRAPTGFRYPSPASDRSLTPPPAPRAPRSPSPRRKTSRCGQWG